MFQTLLFILIAAIIVDSNNYRMHTAPMNAEILMHGTEWNGEEDVTGWTIQEKFDGHRAYWDGFQLWTRSGKPYTPPAGWTDILPQGMPLDGELYSGAGANDVLSRVRRKDGSGWSGLTFVAFDAPAASGGHVRRVATIPQNLLIASVTICTGKAHLQSMLSEVDSRRGEGLMIRPADACYTAGRSDLIRKLYPYNASRYFA